MNAMTEKRWKHEKNEVWETTSFLVWYSRAEGDTKLGWNHELWDKFALIFMMYKPFYER